MDQTPTSPPPAYSQEYTKPPPYNEGHSSNATGQNPPPSGWYTPQPHQYPQQVHIQTENIQQGPIRPTVIAVTTAPAYPGQTQVLVMGNCPSCRIGFLRSEFDICGIILAIVFFPIGVLCCLCMMEKRCSHCGARF